MTTQAPETTEGGAPSQEEANLQEAREEIEEHRQDMEKIVPNKEHQRYSIGHSELRMEFVQKPLSYFGKMEFFSLLGGAIDKMMEGEGVTVTGMLDQVGRGGQLTVRDFRDADVFVRSIARVVHEVPDFLEDAYCIWLNVPRGDREFVKSMMRAPADEGGLSDDDGIKIIQTFIDQNIDAIESFFTERVPKLFKRVKALSTKMGQSPVTGYPS